MQPYAAINFLDSFNGSNYDFLSCSRVRVILFSYSTQDQPTE